MRYVFILLGVVFLAAGSSSAQNNPVNPLLLAAPFSLHSTDSGSLSSNSSSLSIANSPSAEASAPAIALAANPFPSAPAPAISADPQYVQGVFVNYSWQVYVGYTYDHFYGPHGISRNQNGFNYSLVYYFNSWFGLDGEMMATHDSPNNQSSWLLFGGGGPRVRWAAPKGIELWGHALVGYSHLTPQTAFGKQGAFGYELGGGADFPTPWRRLALRAGADMVGTTYFNDHQFSPKAFGGVVFKF